MTDEGLSLFGPILFLFFIFIFIFYLFYNLLALTTKSQPVLVEMYLYKTVLSSFCISRVTVLLKLSMSSSALVM